jgi:hypothetical protein
VIFTMRRPFVFFTMPWVKGGVLHLHIYLVGARICCTQSISITRSKMTLIGLYANMDDMQNNSTSFGVHEGP